VAQVSWSDAAVAGVEDIRRFIASDNPAAAERTAQMLVEAVESLSQLPFRGRRVEGGGRKLVRAPYLIFYRVSSDGESVTITAVIDGRRAT
jgi:plasmid stabilization system protein ParE